jgi:hypothetical protein
MVKYDKFMISTVYSVVHGVAQLVVAVHYKLKSHGFDS